MDFQHRLLRSAGSMMIEKVLQDLPKDPARTLRGLADFVGCMTKSPEQRGFVSIFQNALSKPSSPYIPWMVWLTQQVEHSCLCSLAVNLGCTSFTWGLNTLRRQQQALHQHLPWLAVLDGLPSRTQSLLEEGASLGLYTVVLLHTPLRDAIDLAQALPCHTFFWTGPQGEIQLGCQTILEKTPNLILALSSEEKESSNGLELLRTWRRLFGIYLSAPIRESELEAVIQHAQAQGCAFICLNIEDTFPSCKEEKKRIESCKSSPLLLLPQEIGKLQKCFLPGSGIVRLSKEFSGCFLDAVKEQLSSIT